jgi:hypothetical protein
MIRTELRIIDGRRLVYTYSDENYYIARGGVEYRDAYDPEGSGRVYTETDHKIEDDRLSDA